MGLRVIRQLLASDRGAYYSFSMCPGVLQMMLTIISSKNTEAGSYGNRQGDLSTEPEGVSWTHVEGLYLFIHKQGPPVIKQQQPKAPSQIAYNKVSSMHLLFMLMHT